MRPSISSMLSGTSVMTGTPGPNDYEVVRRCNGSPTASGTPLREVLIVDRHERHRVAAQRDRLALERRVSGLEAARIGACLHEARCVPHGDARPPLDARASHALL